MVVSYLNRTCSWDVLYLYILAVTDSAILRPVITKQKECISHIQYVPILLFHQEMRCQHLQLMFILRCKIHRSGSHLDRVGKSIVSCMGTYSATKGAVDAVDVLDAGDTGDAEDALDPGLEATDDNSGRSLRSDCSKRLQPNCRSSPTR